MKRCVCLAALLVLFASTAFLIRARAVVLPANCPVSLTNPDGQALTLEKYDLRAAVQGPLSLVEMEMVFRNPEARQMEGRFQYLLPPGATISRFAKEVNGKLMEGEVVERLRAQAVYTEILHTMRDPALLEMDQGNRFSARVFPIPANGTVRLLLAYSQVLPMRNGERKLVIPLAGLPKIGSFSFTPVIAREADMAVTGLPDAAQGKLADFTPERDLEITFKAEKKESADALKAGNFQMLSFRPDSLPLAAEQARDWTFCIDTSASNADAEAQRLNALSVLFQQPGFQHGITAFAFDVEVAQKVLYSPLMSSLTDGVIHGLRTRHALGATNLEAALKHIGEQARAAQKPTSFVLVSDGIATLGAREARDVVAALGDWPERHVLHALVIGSKQDEKMLAAIVERTRGRVIVLPFNDKQESEIARVVSELRTPLGASFEFYDEGAAWIYPKTFRDVRLGSELVVFSELKEGAPSKPGVIQRGVDGKAVKDTVIAVTPAESPAFAPLLQREAYHAFLDHLEKAEQAEKSDALRAELHKKRIEVSVKNRVLCPLTSLLVLETENDYRRFGIERTALADIMVIGANGIELKKRGPEDVPPPVARGGVVRALKAKVPASLAEADKSAAPAPTGGPRGDAEHRVGGLGGKDELAEAEALVLNGAGDPGRGGGGGRQAGVQAGEQAVDEPGILPFAGAPRAAEPAATAAPFAPSSSSIAPAEARARPVPNRETGVAPETPRPLEPARESLSRSVAQPPAKAAVPDWVQQYGAQASEEQLNELRAKAQAQPRDRMLRNAYSDALKKAQKWDSLQGEAFAWLPFDPENPQVYEFLGNSATGLNDPELALRAFTSIAEIAPNRAALLARAGWLLITAANRGTGVPPVGHGQDAHATRLLAMSQEMFREALKNRQDDCNIYRGLALSLWLDGKYNDAAKVLEDALTKTFNQRYGDVKRVMREELGYILRAWQKKEPEQAGAANQRANNAGVRLDQYDALRVTMCWETDANDVDLHVFDPNGEECFYQHNKNKSGLELYSDQTQGLGPEVIHTMKAIPGTYHIAVNYFSAGPMGASRGVIVVLQPQDGVTEEPRVVPFCLMPGGPDMRHLGAAKF